MATIPSQNHNHAAIRCDTVPSQLILSPLTALGFSFCRLPTIQIGSSRLVGNGGGLL